MLCIKKKLYRQVKKQEKGLLLDYKQTVFTSQYLVHITQYTVHSTQYSNSKDVEIVKVPYFHINHAMNEENLG